MPSHIFGRVAKYIKGIGDLYFFHMMFNLSVVKANNGFQNDVNSFTIGRMCCQISSKGQMWFYILTKILTSSKVFEDISNININGFEN